MSFVPEGRHPKACDIGTVLLSPYRHRFRVLALPVLSHSSFARAEYVRVLERTKALVFGEPLEG